MPPVNQHLPDQLILGVHFLLRHALDLGILLERILRVGQGGLQLQGRSACLGGVGFVHDDGVVAAPGGVHLLIDDGELLQRGHDDPRAAVDGVPQVLAALVLADGLHRAQGVVEAGDGGLELGVQNRPVRHHDHAGEHGVVVPVVQGRQPVSCPGDGVGLAGPGAVLDQVVVPGAVLGHVGDELAHHVQLVIPGEDQRLLPHHLLRAVGQQLLLLVDLQMDKLLQNVHHAVLLEHFFPKVGRGVPVRVGRVALAAVLARAVAALVEGEKIGVFAPQGRGHPHLRVVHGEEAQNALVELEADLPRVPIVHPLPHGVVHVLPRVGVLQLKGEHGDAVDGQHHVHALVGLSGIEPLPVAGDLVLPILFRGQGVQLRLRLEIAHPKPNAPVLEPVPQHMDKPIGLAGAVEGQTELPLRVHTVGVGEPRPGLGLGFLHESDQRLGEQPQPGVVHVLVPGVPARRGQPKGGDIVLKPFFGGVGDAHKSLLNLVSINYRKCGNVVSLCNRNANSGKQAGIH